MIVKKIQEKKIPVYLEKRVKMGARMKKKIFCLTAILFAFGLNSAGWAEYLITLRNGRMLPVSNFWEEKGIVKFYWQNGIVGLPKKNISSIKLKKTDGPDKIQYISNPPPTADQPIEVPVSAGTQEPVQGKRAPEPAVSKAKVSVELYEKQKALYTEEYEKANERYLQATSRHDREGKKKAWEEMNNFAGQVSVVDEELKNNTPNITSEPRAQ
jgi:hypothetical protein